MDMKQAFVTAAVTVGMIFFLNQFEATRSAMNGGNRYWI